MEGMRARSRASTALTSNFSAKTQTLGSGAPIVVTNLGPSKLDQHVAALNLHRVHRDLRTRRSSLACLRIPLPAVPWANYFPAGDHALAERASAMQADVIHGADFAIHVGDTNGLRAAGKFFSFVKAGEFGLSS